MNINPKLLRQRLTEFSTRGCEIRILHEIRILRKMLDTPLNQIRYWSRGVGTVTGSLNRKISGSVPVVQLWDPDYNLYD